MPSISEEAQDVIRGVHVTLVDLIGALLPGLVWFVLLATVVLQVTVDGGTTPLKTVKEILDDGNKYGGAFYGAVTLVAILLGWVIKARGLDLADKVCAFYLWLKNKALQRMGDTPEIASFCFPYDATIRHDQAGLFEAVTEFATAHLSMKVSERRLFETCKLVLRRSDSLCSEELQRAEAQVALLGSLFLASLFSFVSAVVAHALSKQTPLWDWIATSAPAVAFLGYSFHTDRRKEVDRTYLMALVIAECEREKELERVRESAAGTALLH